MDVLTLYLTSRLLGRNIRRRRLLASAALGAGSATSLSLLLSEGGAISVLCGIAVSVLMTRVLFGKYPSVSRLLRDSAILWGAGTLLGGAMTFVLSLGEPVYLSTGSGFTPALLLCTVFTTFLVRLFSSHAGRRTVSVEIRVCGVCVKLSGLCDSGNSAREPFSSLPVIIARQSSLGDISSKLQAEDCRIRLRVIPIDTVGGHTVLRGFIPDEVYIDGREVAAAVALESGARDYAGHSAIVPECICR